MTFPERNRLVQRVLRTSQSLHTGVDWSNPITRGLGFITRPAFTEPPGLNSVSVQHTYTGTSVVGTEVGLARRYADDFSYGNYGSAVTGCPPTDTPTAMVVGVVRGYSNGQASLVSNGDAELRWNTDGTLQNYCYNNQVASSNTVPVGSKYVAFWQGSGAIGRYAVILNGVLTEVTGTLDWGKLQTITRIGNKPGYRTTEDDIALVAHWGRFLTMQEMLALTANPWQLFAPAQRTIPPTIYRAPVRRLNRAGAKTRTSQPFHSVGVTPTSPFAASLVESNFAGAGSTQVSLTGAAKRSMGPDGPVYVCPDGTQVEIMGGENWNVPDVQRGTLFFRFKLNALDTWGVMFQKFNSTVWRMLLQRSASTNYLSFSLPGNAVSFPTVAVSALLDGKYHTLMLTLENVGSPSIRVFLYIDGVKHAASGNIPTWIPPDLSGKTVFGSSDALYSADIEVVAHGYYRGRVFSEAEAALFSANPWQLFAPQPRTYWPEVIAPTVSVKPVRRSRSIRTAQPPSELSLPVSQSPLQRKLTSLVLFRGGQAVNVLTGLSLTAYGSPAASVMTIEGQGLASSQAGSTGWGLPVYGASTSTGYTFAAVFTPRAGATFNFIARASDTIPFYGINDSNVYHRHGGVQVTLSVGSPSLNKTRRILAAGDSTGSEVWMNGVKLGGAGAPSNMITDTNWGVGLNAIGGGASNTDWSLVATWDRKLSPQEAQSWSANPWQLFAPQPRQGWLTEPAPFAVPMLSGPSATDITNTTAQPRVDVSY